MINRMTITAVLLACAALAGGCASTLTAAADPFPSMAIPTEERIKADAWAAQESAPVPVEAFAIDSAIAEAPYLRLEGFVTNQSLYDVQDVRLHVDVLDADGRPIGETSGWVFGDVLSGGRAYFAIDLPIPGAAYRVTISSFDLLAPARGEAAHGGGARARS